MIVRTATPQDAPKMVALLNDIIALGGSTAHQTPFNTARMVDHYITPALGVSCILLEEDGELLGFQSLVMCDPNWQGEDALPTDWAIIATFVSDQARGKGVGRALFDATLTAAKARKIPTIDATIRADNELGLAYYNALGFKDYAILPAVSLADGTKVDRIRKRMDV